MPWFLQYSLLFVAAFFGGAMNAVAGGGTILTFPVLLSLGVPSIQANATNTLGLVAGMAGSFYGYRQQMHAVKPWLKYFAPVSLIGGLLGAWLLTRTNEKLFDQFVPFLILIATVLFLSQNFFRRKVLDENVSAQLKRTWPAMLLQFAVAVYGGYFGAGIGILMLATLGMLGLHHLHEMNAIKTVLGCLINLVAAIYFVFAGLVVWPEAIMMTMGATVGYFAGSHFSQKISQVHLRRLVGAIGIALSVVFFWQEYLKH